MAENLWSSIGSEVPRKIQNLVLPLLYTLLPYRYKAMVLLYLSVQSKELYKVAIRFYSSVLTFKFIIDVQVQSVKYCYTPGIEPESL